MNIIVTFYFLTLKHEMKPVKKVKAFFCAFKSHFSKDSGFMSVFGVFEAQQMSSYTKWFSENEL